MQPSALEVAEKQEAVLGLLGRVRSLAEMCEARLKRIARPAALEWHAGCHGMV